ncbi:hypothetical protein GCM10025865_19470 [Paraoerskovia sediminicola]|uniref:LytR/CpsA/Psr regulator C-terminal domain-containing protein n=1 Tax=Paraoerskovia sediminicola TaxID=1138587 RepID=A0ABM8G3N9_9CELL|nr:LytR C-terminal domain-containing protein [Paraoerskovia sediminicola]BDZ42648.1 hypothetical protein GCM10025865_19470 [Paraoerskovia sediminicola]
MDSSRYPYQPDEFDAPAAAGAPVGIHRAPRSAWSAVWPFLLVAVVCGALAVAAVAAVASWSDDGSDAAAPAATQAQSPEPSGSAEEPTDEASQEPDEESTEDATDEPTEEPTEEPDADVDLSLEVRVLNDSGISGLAGKVTQVLLDDGFTDVTASNYEGSSLPESAVWYRDESDAATAQKIADDLGIGETRQISDLRANISVILLTDPT